MNGEFVTFKTAKLAKEVGFHMVPDRQYFDKNGVSGICQIYSPLWHDLNTNKGKYECIIRPRQSQLQKWIREVYKIFVTVDIDPDQYKGTINYSADVKTIEVDKEGLRILDGFTMYQTYEEALEEGLFEALFFIQDKKPKLTIGDIEEMGVKIY